MREATFADIGKVGIAELDVLDDCDLFVSCVIGDDWVGWDETHVLTAECTAIPIARWNVVDIWVDDAP